MTHHSAVTCLGCGCSCDDIAVTVAGGRIVEARNACALGAAWFGDGTLPNRVQVAGADVTLDAALDAAARLLQDAARPLIYLAPEITCEAQREAVALADRLHALIDSVTSATALPAVLASQERGRASATLGEVRNRADVLVFWGIDPAERYPRYWTRYAPEPAGVHVPGGRRGRTVIAVDTDAGRGPADADVRVRVPADREVAVLTMIAARAATGAQPEPSRQVLDEPAEVTGTTVTATATTATATDDATGDVGEPSTAGTEPDAVPLAVEQLATVMMRGRYVVIVAEAGENDHGRAGALVACAQALNGPTRAALSLLRPGGNVAGADAVLSWQTGYPVAVDLSRGFPRYRPYDGSAAARLGRGEVDALLVVGAADRVPATVLEPMRGVPRAVIGPRASSSRLAPADVVIDTGMAGIHEAGLAVRMDDVPLPLRQVLEGPPAAAVVIRALTRHGDTTRRLSRPW